MLLLFSSHRNLSLFPQLEESSSFPSMSPGTAVHSACWWLQVLMLMKSKPDTHLQCSVHEGGERRGRMSGRPLRRELLTNWCFMLSPSSSRRVRQLKVAHQRSGGLQGDEGSPVATSKSALRPWLLPPPVQTFSYHVYETSWDVSHATSLWAQQECRDVYTENHIYSFCHHG